jgi:CheY-like chemotaxis protein
MGTKILVVDDEQRYRHLLRVNLEAEGYEVYVARDGTEAIEQVTSKQPDLVILDVMMPRLDGWEVLQSLQSNPATRKIPVLVCSAWDEPELAYSLGAAAFLKKPLLQRTLLDVLYQLNLLE